MSSVVLLRTTDDSEAELVRTLLESYGIPCSISSDIPHSVYPLTVDGLGEIRISVPEEALEEAKTILEEHQKSGDEGGSTAGWSSGQEGDDD